MDFELTPEQQAYRDSIVSFAQQRLSGDTVSRDRDHAFARQAWEAWAGVGIQGLPVPEAYGGSDAGPLMIVLALESLGYGCSDNGLIWFKDADPNRDRSVGNDDASLIAAHYNMPGGYKQGDVDYSGTVNFNDLAIVDRAFGQSLPQLGAPGPPTPTAAGTDRLLLFWPASTATTVTGYAVSCTCQRAATTAPTPSTLLKPLCTHGIRP